MAVVRADEERRRHLSLQHWGLIPFWAKDRSVGSRMINARCETAAEKPAFREALRQRRCLVPASGFYEWTGRRGARRPHYLSPPGDGLFAMAGLWERWRDEAGQVLESCTVLTADANRVVARLHDRMPVILDPKDYEAWLDPFPREPAELVPLLRTCPDDWLAVREVSDRVNDVRFDDAACLEPAGQLSFL